MTKKEIIKKYLPDGVIIVIVLLSAFLFAVRPPSDGQTSVREAATKTPPVEAAAKDMGGAGAGHMESFSGQNIAAEAVSKRNIFSLDGSYEEVKLPRGMSAMPENPYRLLAILQGNEKKALLVDYTGAVIAAPLKKKMIDGYAVVRIGDRSVTLKRGKESKELSVFKQIQPEAGGRAAARKDDKPVAYTLLGVVEEKGRSTAILRDSTGMISTASKGEKLKDGSVITRVDALSVELKLGRETKELRIFNPAVTAQTPAAAKREEAPVAPDLKKKSGAEGRDMVRPRQGPPPRGNQ
jgi:hypothetical protein